MQAEIRQGAPRERFLRLEGGHSYQSSYFGSRTFSKSIKKKSNRIRRPPARRLATALPTEEATAWVKCVKRRRVAHVSNSSPSNSSSDNDDSRGASSESVCDICDQRQPPPSIYKWPKVTGYDVSDVTGGAINAALSNQILPT